MRPPGPVPFTLPMVAAIDDPDPASALLLDLDSEGTTEFPEEFEWTLQRAEPHNARKGIDDRDAWLVLEPFAITGRRVHAPELEWAFPTHAYL